MGGYSGFDGVARGLIAALTPDVTLPTKLSGTRSAGVAAPAARVDHQHGSAIVGVTDGSSAISGDVGEYRETLIPLASAVSLVSGVITNIATLELPAGRWIVGGFTAFTSDATVSITTQGGCLGNTDVAGTFGLTGWLNRGVANVPGVTSVCAAGLSLIPIVNLTVPTIYYLNVLGGFTAGVLKAYGEIHATRIG